MKVRLIGTHEQVLLALCRLRQSFAEVDHKAPVDCRQQPGHVILYCTVKF